MVSSLGMYGVAFQRWRTEPGLWMLAILFTLTLGPCSLHFEYLKWQEIFRPPQENQVGRIATWDQIRMSVDAAIAIMLLIHAVRLAVSVGIENWRRTHT